MAAGKNYGMQTFDQALLNLWMEGQITEDEALRHADSVNNLRLQIKMVDITDTGGDGNQLDQLSGGSTSSGLRI